MVTALPRAVERATALLYAACSCRCAELCSRRAPRRAAQAAQAPPPPQTPPGDVGFGYAPLGVADAATGGVSGPVGNGGGSNSGSGSGGSGSGGAARRFTCVEDEVAAALRMSSLFVPSPPALSCHTLRSLIIESDFSPVRPADPYRPDAAVVIEDGSLFTAQCGGDAFVLAGRFLDKLEVVQRDF